MIIPLNKAFEFLKNCSAVIIDDDALVYPFLNNSITGGLEDEWLYLEWLGDNGEEYNTRFKEGNNKQVNVMGSAMYLTDTEGDEVKLTLLSPMKLDS